MMLKHFPDAESSTLDLSPISKGLTVDALIEMKHKMMDSRPRAIEWATSDMERVICAIMADQTMVPISDEEMKTIGSPSFYGIPIILDESLPPDVLVEMRDQHGNSLGRVKAF